MKTTKDTSLELNMLPQTLIYELLDQELEHPVIVNKDLSRDKNDRLFNILRKYPTTLGYNISYLKGISPLCVCIESCLNKTKRLLENTKRD